MARWVAAVADSRKNADGKTFTLVYTLTDGNITKTIKEDIVSDPAKVIEILQNAENYANREEDQKAKIAAFDPTTVVASLDDLKAQAIADQQAKEAQAQADQEAALTQDQKDLTTFQQLIQDFNLAKSAEDIYEITPPAGKDSATVLALIQKAYKDEYYPLLRSGRF